MAVFLTKIYLLMIWKRVIPTQSNKNRMSPWGGNFGSDIFKGFLIQFEEKASNNDFL
jgi:hypothetical protein